MWFYCFTIWGYRIEIYHYFVRLGNDMFGFFIVWVYVIFSSSISRLLSNFVQIFPFLQVTWGCYFHRIYWYLFPYKGFWQFHPMDLVTRWCYWCWNIHPWTYDDHCFWFPFSVWCWLKSSPQTYQTYWEDPKLQMFLDCMYPAMQMPQLPYLNHCV